MGASLGWPDHAARGPQALSGLGAGLLAVLTISPHGTVLIGTPRRFTSARRRASSSVERLGRVRPCSWPPARWPASWPPAAARPLRTVGARASGLFFVLRMVADAPSSLTFLHWLTPLGWIDQLQPFTNPQPQVLALICALTAVLGAGAVALAGRRDLGASVPPDRSSATAHTFLLGGPLASPFGSSGPPCSAGWPGCARCRVAPGLKCQGGDPIPQGVAQRGSGAHR